MCLFVRSKQLSFEVGKKWRCQFPMLGFGPGLLGERQYPNWTRVTIVEMKMDHVAKCGKWAFAIMAKLFGFYMWVCKKRSRR